MRAIANARVSTQRDKEDGNRSGAALGRRGDFFPRFPCAVGRTVGTCDNYPHSQHPIVSQKCPGSVVDLAREIIAFVSGISGGNFHKSRTECRRELGPLLLIAHILTNNARLLGGPSVVPTL